jgi:hypothetical protein
MKNKLYTLSYFRKRLHSASIDSRILVKAFVVDGDTRYWTLSLFPKTHNIFCTCYKDETEFWFELWDGGNKLKNETIIRTKSMNVVIDSIYSLLTNK